MIRPIYNAIKRDIERCKLIRFYCLLGIPVSFLFLVFSFFQILPIWIGYLSVVLLLLFWTISDYIRDICIQIRFNNNGEERSKDVTANSRLHDKIENGYDGSTTKPVE